MKTKITLDGVVTKIGDALAEGQTIEAVTWWVWVANFSTKKSTNDDASINLHLKLARSGLAAQLAVQTNALLSLTGVQTKKDEINDNFELVAR